VNEELSREDVRAITETGDLSQLEALLKQRLKRPKDALEKQRLAMLGWLAKRGLLEVRVGVMRHGAGIVHAKFGVITDEAGDALVFSGSGNESAQGLLANYERLEVSTSWEDMARHCEYTQEFDALWTDSHPDVHTVTLPEALRLKLVKFAPREPPITEPSNALARQKTAMIWRFIVEAPYLPNGDTACDATAMVDLWPHQRRVVEEVAGAWPEGRLLCDEVGLGKTIEAILVLRRLMAGRGVRRVLILLPAGLLKQWQAELREKGGILVPRLEGTTALVWPDERTERVNGLAEALEREMLLVSRETARTENNLPLLLVATPWDLVILDEAHAARRRKQEEGEFNSGTLLLTVLRRLQLRQRTRGILLLSATPMQTHPWEPWDLLAVLGEGGRWLADFAHVRDFYTVIAAVQNGRCDREAARKAVSTILADPRFPKLPGGGSDSTDPDSLTRRIAFPAPSQRQEVARWLRQHSPLARRMHRNTRTTLKRYHEIGLLPDLPPHRRVEDIVFDYQDPAEREVYNSIGRYIEKRFHELEAEKPGKGFVMTIYRRRASSSPFALERSLERRREGLLRVAERRAYDVDLSYQDVPEAVDPDDLPEGEDTGKVSSAFPSDPQVARAELVEVDSMLEGLRALRGRDTKRDRFFDVLRHITEDGRPVLVFTEYTDTLEYLRESLLPFYEQCLACYSGDGGRLWDGATWQPVTKDVIPRALHAGGMRVMICTDAASEGLNLQAAGAVMNYDLPWNPSKVEQRIGRIDRIGQKLPEVRVVNLFLRESVDDRVYRVLQERCGLFEHFVGAMQPVLARARRMLLGQEQESVQALERAAREIAQDPLANETYVDSLAAAWGDTDAVLTRSDIVRALAYVKGDVGVRVRSDNDAGRHVIWGSGFPKTVVASTVEALERDHSVVPLSPLDPRLHRLAESLTRPGECLPLVVGSSQSGSFRRSIISWIGDGEVVPVESVEELTRRVDAWDGTCPDPVEWLSAQNIAQREAEAQVELMEHRAMQCERDGLQRQRDSARLRLQYELGRYLACLGGDTADLNGWLYHQMSRRDIASAQRLKRCLEKLGGYPDWNQGLCDDIATFVESLTENQRKARLLGKELDAALDDPRWTATMGQGDGG
jgi:superfamily II DNA or RNA helicase